MNRVLMPRLEKAYPGFDLETLQFRYCTLPGKVYFDTHSGDYVMFYNSRWVPAGVKGNPDKMKYKKGKVEMCAAVIGSADRLRLDNYEDEVSPLIGSLILVSMLLLQELEKLGFTDGATSLSDALFMRSLASSQVYCCHW